MSWPPLRWDPALEQHIVRAHDLPRRPQRPRSRAGIELPPYYHAVQVERQLERASALGYLVLPEARVEQLRLLAWRNTWWRRCAQERYPFVYVLVGRETLFGRRLALHWDTGFLIADRELDERLRAAWGACRDAWEAWWRQMPQAACRAMVPRPSSSICEWAVSGGMVRAVEGAPRPIELAFDALNAAFGRTACEAPTAEWQAVADARAYEALHPPRLARALSWGPTRTCAECKYTFVDAGADRVRHRNWHDRTLNGLRLPNNLASGMVCLSFGLPTLCRTSASRTTWGSFCDGPLVTTSICASTRNAAALMMRRLPGTVRPVSSLYAAAGPSAS